MGCIGDSLQSKCAQRRECPKNFEYFLHKTSQILCIKFATHTVQSQSFTPYARLFHKLVHREKTEKGGENSKNGDSLLTNEDGDNDRDYDNSFIGGRWI